MWEEGQAEVADIFFQDEIEFYENEYIENDIGETIEQPTLVGTYPCNIQNAQSTTQSTVSGQSIPQAIRISTLKTLPFDYEHTYKVKITKARIRFSNELWKVDGFVEGQLSTVISASRSIRI